MITKSKAIIVLHASPATLRFGVYDTTGGLLRLVSGGIFAGLGAGPRMEVMDTPDLPAFTEDIVHGEERFGHREAFRHLLRFVYDHWGQISTIAAVGHHVAHGGADFVVPTLVTPEVLDALEPLTPLAPQLLPHNLAAIRAVGQVRPDLPQIACFDTAFHRGRPRVSEETGLPAEYFNRGIRRWGFLGLACESITAQLAQLAPQLAAGRILIAHLGATVGLSAIRGNRSMETTLGFSTSEGLPMATRPGSLDPAAMLCLLRQMPMDELDELLSERSGLLGFSDISGDVQTLLDAGAPRAAQAVDFFVYRVTREIGSMVAALGGIDAMVFTACIGERVPVIRSRICQRFDWLGVELDTAANDAGRNCISRPGRTPSVWVIRTDEQRVIAQHTMKILTMLPPRPAVRRPLTGEIHGMRSSQT